MIYPIYKSIKTELVNESFLKNISWYNNQYESGLVLETSAFIEFNAEALSKLMSKDTGTVDIPIRIHYVKKLMATADGTVKDADIESFDTEGAAIIKRLDRFMPEDDDLNTLAVKPLKFVSITPFQRLNGWQAWFIDFTLNVDKNTIKNAAAELVTITASIVGNGSVISIPTNLAAVKKGQTVILSAIPATGSSFKNIIIDGLTYTSSLVNFKASKSLTAVIEFLSSIMLTMYKTGYGSVSPDVGTYSKVEGEETTLIATPLDTGFDKTDSYFEKYVINTVDVLTNPYALTMDIAKDAQARFKLWNIDNLLLNSIPENNRFINTGAGKDADINNVRVGTFSAASYITNGLSLVGQLPINITFSLYYTATTTKTIFLAGTGVVNSKGILIQVNTSNLLNIRISNGTNQQTANFHTLMQNTNYIINIDWNGLVGGNINVNVNGYLRTVVATHEWTGNSATVMTIGNTSVSVTGEMYFFKLNGVFEYILNHNQGSTIFDISGNGNNGTVTGANLLTFWGSTENNIEPFDLTKGATLYQNNSDSTIMPICFNTSQVITGFTRLGWFPAGSGILKGLPNTYEINGVAETFDTLKAKPITDTLIKIETANNISYYKERSKDV